MGWVPRLRRYHGQLGLPALLSRLARFPSLGGTSLALCLRSSRAHERGSHGPGRCFGSRPSSLFARKALDLPGSWGTSACVPRSSTPVEPLRQVFSAPRCCLPCLGRRRPPQPNSLGAQSRDPHARCLRFAARVTPAPRKTRFRLVTNLAGRGSIPRKVPLEGFSNASSHHFLLRQAFLAHPR
jgi:hypothetical protein